MVEQPKVEAGRVTGWDVGWGHSRPFAIDMAGFAVNLQRLLTRTSAKFAYKVKIGYQESEFLKHLARMDELEPKSVGKVNVWHTQTKDVNLDREKHFQRDYQKSSDDGIEV